MVTTKKLHLKSIVYELLWFLAGDTNVAYLQENGVRIWNEWADENGDLGPFMVSNGDNGSQRMASYRPSQQAIDMIKNNPNSRRIIVSAWNVGELKRWHLCRVAFSSFMWRWKTELPIYQRSADVFLGVPFNIASYALLTHMMAQVCGLEAGTFVHHWRCSPIHQYLEQAKLQLSRTPIEPLPTLKLNPDIKNIDDFTYDDIEVLGYEHHPHIKAPIE